MLTFCRKMLTRIADIAYFPRAAKSLGYAPRKKGYTSQDGFPHKACKDRLFRIEQRLEEAAPDSDQSAIPFVIPPFRGTNHWLRGLR
jgi:hypothetical protein